MAGKSAISNNKLGANHAEELMKGLNALRAAKHLFDVTLIVEDKSFKAHRVVLAACSDYFCVMFNAFSEASQPEIQLKGVNARGMELLLEYAYTAQLDLDVNNVQDVLAASTHVQMNTVTDACSHFLETQIDVDNFVAIAALADLYSLELLRKKVYRFICSQLSELCNCAEFESLEWKQFEYILSSNYPVDCTELRVLEITFKYCQKKYPNSYVMQRLCEHIHWDQIANLELIEKIREGGMYKSILGTELKKRIIDNLEKRMKISVNGEAYIGNDDKTDNESNIKGILSPEVLINSRGMELALIKIGGFETNGLTNNINCYLPTKGKWEFLTVIPHIEQCKC